MASGLHQYCVYGIAVDSDQPLALPEHGQRHLASVSVRAGSPAFFREVTRDLVFPLGTDDFYQYAPLANGSSYVRTRNVGEFVVSGDGRLITVRRFEEASVESFQVYLLGRSISFALVKQGFEPLHATVVLIGDSAVAFLGDSGFGKSSLAACFLQAGHRLLTDDLLIVTESSHGLMAYPGPPRIKVFPNIARRFLGRAAQGVPMNPDSSKVILPLGPCRGCENPAPLAAIYAITPPEEPKRKAPVSIEALSARDSFLELVKHTFNYRLTQPARLARQFAAGTRLVAQMPVRRLAYPRVLKQLPEVRQAVIEDLERLIGEAAA